MSSLSHFRSELQELVAQRGLGLARWAGGTGTSRNLLEITTAPKLTVLYVKVFNVPDKPGFWGLTRNHVTRLEAADVRWFAVLLLRSSTSGYLLTGTQVQYRVRSSKFELSSDGDFKVNEHADLDPAQHFTDLRALLERTL